MARLRLNPTLGPEVCDWIEAYLCHGPGDVQGEPVEIDDEYRAFIYRCYEVYPKGHVREGRRVYRRAFLSRPKGRAKSELAGMIACAEGLAPVRFDGWKRVGSAYVPVARPIVSPFVRCFATEEGQAGNTFDNCFFMLSEAVDHFPGLDVGLTRINLPGGGSIVATTSAAASKDGGKDTFNVFDETHLYVSAALKALHSTVIRNLMKRKAADGWGLDTSTMYAIGEGSVAEETHRSSQAVPGVLFDHRQAPEDIDLGDDEALLAALEEVYGPAAAWMDLEALIRDEFRDPTKSEADNRRYWLNQPWKRQVAGVDAHVWRSLVDEERTVDDKTPIVVGFKASHSAVALIGETQDGHLFEMFARERPQGPDGDTWSVPRADVTAAVAAAFRRYEVRLMYAAPAGWVSDIEQWGERWGAKVVLAFPVNSDARMAPACDRFAGRVADGTARWQGEILSAHVLQLSRRTLPVPDGEDGTTRFVWSRMTNRPNDAGIAATLAEAARAAADWAPKKAAPRVVNLAAALARADAAAR